MILYPEFGHHDGRFCLMVPAAESNGQHPLDLRDGLRYHEDGVVYHCLPNRVDIAWPWVIFQGFITGITAEA